MVNRWGNNGNTVTDFILGGSKITADGDCSHDIKRCLLLESKFMSNLDSIFKSRDITLPTKVHLVKAMVFPVSCIDVRVGCEESWAQKNWCFWTVVWEKTLTSPLDTGRSSQSILKEITPGCSLEGLMLRLKLQYFGHLMWRVDSLENMGAGAEGDNREWDGWVASPTRCTWVWMNSGSWWWTGRPGMLWFMGLQRVGHDWVTEPN